MKIALMLSGAMGKGAYQYGVLKSLSKYFKPQDFSIVCATSVGVLNGYGYFTGRMEELENIWCNVCGVEDKIFITKLIKSDYLAEKIKSFSENPIDVDFYLNLLTMQLRERKLNFINIKDVKEWARRHLMLSASVRVPLFCKPVMIDGIRHYDGGCVVNNPIEPLLDAEFDYVISIYCESELDVFEHPKLKGKAVKICFDDGTLLKSSTYFYRESIPQMIKRGEELADVIFKHTFDQGTDNLEAILENIKTYDAFYESMKGGGLTNSKLLSTVNKLAKFILTEKP